MIFITHSGLSQSSINKQHPKKITISIRETRIKEAILELERITGLHFVYSSNKIDERTRVTLHASDRSLEEVLGLLAAQTNLSFKRNDQYVIVKAGNAKIVSTSLPQLRPETKILHYSLALPDSTPLHASARALSRPELSNPPPTLEISKRHFKNHFKELGLYFDTARLKVLPAREVKQINVKSRHRGWFISAGPRLSEYSTGAEIMGGIRSLYVVFSPGVLKKTGKYHGAFGLGTSMLLSGDFSFHPMYTYFVIKERSLMPAVLTFESAGSRGNLAFTARHHQLKLMVQYAFSKNLNLRFGPIVNSLHTTYYAPQHSLVLLPDEPVSSAEGTTTTTTTTVKQVDYYPSQPAQTGKVQYISRNPEKLRLWMNWEATLSFRLNFFNHK